MRSRLLAASAFGMMLIAASAVAAPVHRPDAARTPRKAAPKRTVKAVAPRTAASVAGNLAVASGTPSEEHFTRFES